ncbi:MAG: hypothetical protein AAGJ28_16470, partial [Pseudomonadota bacterium]
MGDLSVTFAPLLPVALIWVLAAIAVAGLVAAAYWRLPGWWLRACAYAVLVLALAGPQLRTEEREGLPNVAFMVVDRSASTELEDRTAQIEAAAKALTQAVAQQSTPSDPMELITIDLSSEEDGRDRGTRLLTALDEAAARVSPAQIAGAVVLTDGQIHDPERLEAFPGPVHALIAGEEDAFDVRLALQTAPAFGIVGEDVTFRVSVEALGEPPTELGTRVPAQISVDGGTPRPILLPIGRTTDLDVTIEHGGPTV